MNIQLEIVLKIVALVFAVLCFVVSSWTLKTMIMDDRIYHVQRLLLLVFNLAWFVVELFKYHLFHEISGVRLPFASFFLLVLSLWLFLLRYRSKITNTKKTEEDKVVSV